MAKPRATILQIIPRLDTGGAELSAIEITEAIVRAGGRALVATEGGRLAGKVTEAGGELVTFPAGTKNPVRILTNARALVALIGREGIDLVHARSRAPAWSALIAARRAKVPFVTTYHGAYGENGQLKRLYNSVMARADLVIANSGYTGNLVRARYGTPEDKVRVIHRGVDLHRYRPDAVAPERVAKLREAWGVTPDVPLVLQAARLTSWKGQAVLIEAAARLRQQGRLANAVVILAGDAQGRDGYADGLRTRIHALGLDGTVRLVGHVEDIAAAFVAARVTVIASTEPEAFGRTATEAQAMGCPVIATRIGAPPETVLAEPAVAPDAATGWLVPPGDAQALAEALGAALALPDAERKAREGRAASHVANHFSLEKMKRETLAVYDTLLGAGLGAAFDSATNMRDFGAGTHPAA
ncbi:MAG: glycosyltransferase family 4 protein [Hyphomicrobiaceae bacterium]